MHRSPNVKIPQFFKGSKSTNFHANPMPRKKKTPTDSIRLRPMGATSREQAGHFLSMDALPI
jgi:hypothetical protein